MGFGQNVIDGYGAAFGVIPKGKIQLERFEPPLESFWVHSPQLAARSKMYSAVDTPSACGGVVHYVICDMWR